jgi:hypothetical protein
MSKVHVNIICELPTVSVRRNFILPGSSGGKYMPIAPRDSQVCKAVSVSQGKFGHVLFSFPAYFLPVSCAIISISLTSPIHVPSHPEASEFFVSEQMKMFAMLDKAKPDTGNTRGLNLAVVMFTTVQVSRLSL